MPSDVTLTSEPTLNGADRWFQDSVVPMRTTAAGFSPNRHWKSPARMVTGNQEDPNGLCGDAAFFVNEEFFRKFGGYTTLDGFQIGVILWNGEMLNHIANVMLPKQKTAPQKYVWRDAANDIVGVSGKIQFAASELWPLHVYDLYYKQATTVDVWWSWRDSNFGGSIKLGMIYNIDDD